MTELGDRPIRTARELARRTGVEHHDVLVILGTGLAGVAGLLGASGPSLPLATLPFFPRYTATGHHAEAWSVPMGGQMVLVFAGRCHLYEGIEVDEVVHPLRTGIAAGCSTVVLTAAVGGIREDLLTDGTVVAVTDQINLTGRSPLSGPQFVEMAGAYSPRLRAAALATPGVPPVAEGIYAQVLGPQFETAAEVAMLRQMGADVVGMSMAIETIAARHAGAQVLGLAVVTNAAAGATAEIGAAGAAATGPVAAIVRHVVGSLG
jgi:purine-nucleoside phosphorylase